MKCIEFNTCCTLGAIKELKKPRSVRKKISNKKTTIEKDGKKQNKI